MKGEYAQPEQMRPPDLATPISALGWKRALRSACWAGKFA
jgi:hypothetical protein